MSETVERVTPGTRSWEQYGAEHLQRYEYFKEFYRDKTVADAACGTGYGTHLIASYGAKKATGLDLAADAIDFCQKNYKLPNLEYKLHDCGNLEKLGTKFDLVVSFETIEHLRFPETFVKSVAATLNPGGIFICSTPNKARLSGSGYHNPYHPSELEWEEFKRIVSKYFSIESMYQQSESVEYLRYQEALHRLHQERARTNAFFFNRLELWLRKLAGRNFKPINYMHESLADLRDSDIRIERLAEPKSWHKTFIIVGRVK